MNALARLLRSKPLHLLSLLAVALLTSGCASVKITSNRDPNFTQKLTRLYVLVDHHQLPVELSEKFRDNMEIAMAAYDIQGKVCVMAPTDLDPKAHLKSIQEYNADGILVIQANGVYLTESGGFANIIYDASLYRDRWLEHRIWRARVEHYGGSALINLRLRKMADAVALRMVQDNLF